MESSKTRRNEAIECGRLFAAFCVVFIHVGFSQISFIKSAIDCVACFAVPFFFVVSGYYAYQTNEEKVGKRIKHMAKLIVIAMAVYFAWLCFWQGAISHQSVGEFLKSMLYEYNIARWIFLNGIPPTAHLWYLSAAMYCWIALWVYIKFQGDSEKNYKPIYTVSMCLLAIHILLSLNVTAVGISVAGDVYRNAMFFGFPMFSLGLFLHEYRDRITAVFGLKNGRLLLMMIAGVALSLLQWRGIGSCDMPVGMILTVSAFLLLLLRHPSISRESKLMAGIIARFGRISTNIYIMHIMWFQIYGIIFKDKLMAISAQLEACLRPFIIILVSLAFACLCELVLELAKGYHKCLAKS